MAESSQSTQHVKLRGPLFTGDHGRAASLECARELTDRVVRYANEAVHVNLHTSIRHPTPYYETQINILERGIADRSVNDRGVIYGPWLEGTSSRNQSTRFKGYASFRRATQQTRGALNSLSGAIIKKYVTRMGSTR